MLRCAVGCFKLLDQEALLDTMFLKRAVNKQSAQDASAERQ